MARRSSVFRLEADQESDEAVMYLYGYVVEDRPWWDEGNGSDFITDKEVREALAETKAARLRVHINSFGGSAFTGVAISNLLKNHGAYVTAHIDGIAASAASVIAMGADRIVMPSNAMMMLHCASTFV